MPRAAEVIGGFKAIAILAMAAVLLMGVTAAQAELTERGDLFVRFEGGISPSALPREQLAPISIRVSGTVRTLSGERPPALRRIKIALNRGGRVDSKGLPVCHMSQINGASGEQALAACGDALVGRGSFASDTAYPDQDSFPSNGRILAFNSRLLDGGEAILAHIYGTFPVPTARVIVFHVRHTRGTYGTVLSGALPTSLNRHGWVTHLSLVFHRRYTWHGRSRSYVSATCAAPVGFPGAVFPFARASMAFEDGRTLSSVLTRNCRVRG